MEAAAVLTNLKCGRCSSYYDTGEHKPKHLPNCSHVYCLKCLLVLEQSKKPESFTCPSCGVGQIMSAYPNGVADLPIETLRLEILNGMLCKDCNYQSAKLTKCSVCQLKICKKCKQKHRSSNYCYTLRILCRIQDCASEDLISRCARHLAEYEKINIDSLHEQMRECEENIMAKLKIRFEKLAKIADGYEESKHKMKDVVSSHEFVKKAKSRLRTNSNLAALEEESQRMYGVIRSLSKEDLRPTCINLDCQAMFNSITQFGKPISSATGELSPTLDTSSWLKSEPEASESDTSVLKSEESRTAKKSEYSETARSESADSKSSVLKSEELSTDTSTSKPAVSEVADSKTSVLKSKESNTVTSKMDSPAPDTEVSEQNNCNSNVKTSEMLTRQSEMYHPHRGSVRKRICCKSFDQTDVAVCSHTGHLYVATSDQVIVYSDWKEITRFKTGATRPHLTMNRSRRLILSDSYGEDPFVHIYNPVGEWITKFNRMKVGRVLDRIEHPHCVACDNRNRIYVVDVNVNRITVHNADGGFDQLFAENHLDLPCGIAINHENNVIVTQFRCKNILVLGPKGELMKTVSKAGSRNLTNPYAVCVDRDGFILIVDGGHHRLYGNPTKTPPCILVYTPDMKFHCQINVPELERNSWIEGIAISAENDIVITHRNRVSGVNEILAI